MAKVAVVYHSGYGHTKLQAELETAELYGKRVAEITLQFVRGRRA